MVETYPPHPDQPTEPRYLTEDEAKLVSWLMAERDWHREVAEWQREKERRAAKKKANDRIEREREARRRNVLDDHAQLVESATGFRRASLERHAPRGFGWHLTCSTCVDRDDYDPDQFPCDEYEFARDWRDDHSESGCSDTDGPGFSRGEEVNGLTFSVPLDKLIEIGQDGYADWGYDCYLEDLWATYMHDSRDEAVAAALAHLAAAHGIRPADDDETLAVLRELAESVCEQYPLGHCQDSDDRTTWCLSCRARGLVAGGK